jgi:dTDP-glucose pyrophosphorylase
MPPNFSIADISLSADSPISQAIECLDRSDGEIALVVDENRRLIGTITDGDVRRGLLRGARLADPAMSIMNASPQSAPIGTSANVLSMQFEHSDIRQVPLVDASGCIVDVVLLSNPSESTGYPNIVVLMAGGVGTRLRPLTSQVPKPMLRVGDKPILETIIESFVLRGFHRFVISVNYLAEQIEHHFGDGSRLGAEIVYLRESQQLGTAGALSLLPFVPRGPIFVMNGDILTTTDFTAMLRFHSVSEALATMGVNNFHFNVPYGVAEVEGERIRRLKEKPRFDFLVNSGIYVLSPDVIDFVPKNRPFNMPQLFEKVIAEGGAACAFPIHEHWFDVGYPADLERAGNEFRAINLVRKSGLRRADIASDG